MKKKTSKIQKVIIFLAIAAIISFLLSIPAVGTAFANIFKWPAAKVISAARYTGGILVALILMAVGASVISVPILGASLVIIGVALLAWQVWPMFKKKDTMAVK